MASPADSSDPTRALGRAIRKTRRDRDITQSDLAARSGLSHQHVSSIERGDKDPRMSTIRKLAAALDVHGVELLAWLDAAGFAAPNQDASASR